MTTKESDVLVRGYTRSRVLERDVGSAHARSSTLLIGQELEPRPIN